MSINNIAMEKVQENIYNHDIKSDSVDVDCHSVLKL